MRVKILKKTPNELKLEIEGSEHAFCNLLQKRLLEGENVDLAGYDIPHPLVSNSIFSVRTKGNVKPEEALRKAVKRTLKLNKDFRKEFERILKI